MAETSPESRFRRLYDEYHRAILSYFLRRMEREDAYEAAADVYLIAWRKLDTVPGGDRALAWLYAVARRVLANRRRKATRFARLVNRAAQFPSESDPGPEPVVVRNADYQAVTDALARLSHRDQEVLRLAVWDELPHADIGALLGCSAGAVDVRLHRATRRLAKAFDRSVHKPGRRPAFLHGEEQ